MSVTSRQVWKFFQTNWSTFISYHWWLMSEGRALCLLVVFALHSSSFSLSVQQCVMCQLQKLNKPDNTPLTLQRTCIFPQQSLVSKYHSWLGSNLCFLFIHQKLILSAEQYTQRFSHLKNMSLDANSLIYDSENNWKCYVFFYLLEKLSIYGWHLLFNKLYYELLLISKSRYLIPTWGPLVKL